MIRLVRAFACVVFLLSLAGAALGQAAPAFEVADIHTSPHTLQPFARSIFQGNRFMMRQANMVDLIAKAYGVDPNNVVGGPSWLETDRFDIYAKAPLKTSSETINLMLRELLADRFKLVVHTGSKPLPAFVLTTGKGAQKLTQADDSAESSCKFIDPPPNPPPGSVPLYTFSCKNTSMAAFVEDLHQWAGD